MPWLIDDVEDKIQTALGISQLNSLRVERLICKSVVANEFLDLLCSYDMPEYGLDKLSFKGFSRQCEPFEDEVVSRLANMCTRLSHLSLTVMDGLTEAGRLSMVSLFRQIIQNSPPIEGLDMIYFSQGRDDNENIGELVLESLLSSRIDSVKDLNLGANSSWFKHPENANLLAELISKQAGLQHIRLGGD